MYASQRLQNLVVIQRNQQKVWWYKIKCVPLQCQEEILGYAAECGEQGFIDTAPYK